MDLEDLLKGKHKKNKKSWYPGKLLFKLIEAVIELIGSIILVVVIFQVFDFDFTSLAGLGGTIITFLIVRFIWDELS